MEHIKDAYLMDCKTYEDYLDSFITYSDIRYLRSMQYSRMLVELGYRTAKELLTKEQFDMRRKAINEILYPTKKSVILFSAGLKITDPVLLELAHREQPNNRKDIATIIFLRHVTRAGFEISGYIDFEHSLKKANMKQDDAIDWRAVFAGKKKLRPQPTDLSYHDWRSGVTLYNNSDNFQISNFAEGWLSFMHKGDRKFVGLFPTKGKLVDFVSQAPKSMIYSDKYNYVMLYDHIIRRKM